jgi:hypothetical protein
MNRAYSRSALMRWSWPRPGHRESRQGPGCRGLSAQNRAFANRVGVSHCEHTHNHTARHRGSGARTADAFLYKSTRFATWRPRSTMYPYPVPVAPVWLGSRVANANGQIPCACAYGHVQCHIDERSAARARRFCFVTPISNIQALTPRHLSLTKQAQGKCSVAPDNRAVTLARPSPKPQTRHALVSHQTT